jgi:DNA-binding beta-propeller fold protein YncE
MKLLTALTLLINLITSPAFAADQLRNVVVVGNAVSGTVSVLDEKTFANLGKINVIPDIDERMEKINSSFLRKFWFNLIRRNSVLKVFEPSRGERYVDDVHLSPDGTRLYVSRGGLGDIAAFDLTQAGFPLLWRKDIKGYKADHAALSPDGLRYVVSASLKKKVYVFNAADGKPVGSFKTGQVPHQNDFSEDGNRIYNASLGLLDQPALPHGFKGPRLLTVADAKTLKVIRTYKFDQGIRPSAITPDETIMYAQLSFLNGVIKFDLKTGKTLKTVTQPLNEYAKATYPTKEHYPHESVRHGLALSGDGTKLCDAFTIGNEVSIISTAEMKVEASIPVGVIPYWASTSSDGRYCFVSLSGSNSISVIDYEAMREVARVGVEIFPQRNRPGKISERAIGLLAH